MRNWIFILIFSSLLGNMNAHQVQLVTHHEKTNGVLIRVVVSNVPEVDDIAGWVGQENWFYLTLNEAVFAENVLENLKASSSILEIEGIQNQQSVQIGFLMENYISDFEISVIDITGKLLFKDLNSNKYSNYSLDMTNFSSGVYFLQIESKNRSKIIKLMLN